MRLAEKILIVDDDVNLLAGLRRHLGQKFDLMTAEGGIEALGLAQNSGPFAVAVCDMRMPGMDGVEVLRRLQEISPDTVRIMLTGNADQKTAINAINDGRIFRFFNKPCPMATLIDGIEAAIRQHQLIQGERALLEGTLAGSISLLSDVLSLVAPDIFHRSRRIHGWAVEIARHMKLGDAWVVEMAAELSQLGAIAVPPEVLARHHAGQHLSAMEQEMIHRVPAVGAALIKKIPRLEPVARAVQFSAGGERDFDQRSLATLPGRILKVLLNLDRIAGANPSKEALVALEKEGGYDLAVLAAVGACLLTPSGQSDDGAEIRIAVPATGICAGDVLVSDLTLESGRLVLAAGETISDLLFLRLQNINAMARLKEPIMVRRFASRPRAN
jgi:response regulator RpfG family c-di-GMP phosphodiesterase